MKREQLFSALRRWCRKNGMALEVDTLGGKGSHVKIHVGGRATIVKAGELSPVYVEVILKQLGVPKDSI
ncbi:MAG: hypothetical protein KIS68_05590 [Bauldia sp.]|nr:hypothetical protein [Bauldia sp.]